jgi:hypothetical protein
MIVVGVDVHKHSLTAVAVDERGRTVAEQAGPVAGQVFVWARSLQTAQATLVSLEPKVRTTVPPGYETHPPEASARA